MAKYLRAGGAARVSAVFFSPLEVSEQRARGREIADGTSLQLASRVTTRPRRENGRRQRRRTRGNQTREWMTRMRRGRVRVNENA